jgi:hypothetical protein
LISKYQEPWDENPVASLFETPIMKTKQNLFVLFLCCSFAASAQSDSASRNVQFKLSLNYNTGLNYYGRTDSLKSSGFFPMAELWLTPKFYVNAAPVFVSNRVQRFVYAGTVTTAGYQNATSKWLTGVYVSKPFYTSGSELVQSALKAQGGVSVSFLNKYLNLNTGGDVKFSDKTDFGATAGVDHLVRLQNEDKSVWVFDPSLYAYAGTQNFQRSYYKKVSNGSLLFPTTSQQLVNEQATRFAVLSVEASLPVVYAKGKWTFVANPAYVLPQNLIAVAGRPDLSERGENGFYATLTAKYSF